MSLPIDAVTGGDLTDANEKQAGVTVSGTAKANSLVSLVWGSTEKSVTADVAGKWSATFNRLEVPASGLTSLKVTAIDSAGNASGSSERQIVVVMPS